MFILRKEEKYVKKTTVKLELCFNRQHRNSASSYSELMCYLSALHVAAVAVCIISFSAFRKHGCINAFHFFYDELTITTNAPIIDLPDSISGLGISYEAFGAIEMVKALYASQGMTAPVDYSCVYSVIA